MDIDGAFDEFDDEHEAEGHTGNIDGEITISMADVKCRALLDSVAEVVATRFLGRGCSKAAIAKKVEERVHAALDQRIDKIVEEKLDSLMSMTLRRTDSFGSPVGEPQTVSEIIAAGVEPYLNQRVDSNGRPCKSESWHGSPTRLEHTIGAVLDRKFEREVSQASKDARKRVDESLTSKAASIMAEALSRV